MTAPPPPGAPQPGGGFGEGQPPGSWPPGPYSPAPGAPNPLPGYYAPAGPAPGTPGTGAQYPGQPVPAQTAATCTWHPDRVTALQCSRCGRPACPECLTPASVGFQCRQCVADGRATQRVARTVAGSRVDETPIVSYLLIAINVLVFAVTAIQAKSLLTMDGSAWFNGGLLIPGVVAHGEWWRVVTSGFIHIGVIHLIMNMVSLWLIGPALERFVGRVRFLVIYLVSMLGGSVAVLALTSYAASAAGASGAIFGILGALAVAFRRHRLDMRQLIIVLVLNLWFSFQFAGISWQAHVGGLITGALIGAVMVYPPARTRMAWQVGGTVAILAVLGAIYALKLGQINECLFQGSDLYCLRTS